MNLDLRFGSHNIINLQPYEVDNGTYEYIGGYCFSENETKIHQRVYTAVALSSMSSLEHGLPAMPEETLEYRDSAQV